MDLTGLSPVMGLRVGVFKAGQTALKAATCEVTKHEKSYIENQHVLISFAFDTFGFLAANAVELLNRVKWFMHNSFMSPRSMNMVFKRIDFLIQKGLMMQLVVCLPFQSLYYDQ